MTTGQESWDVFAHNDLTRCITKVYTAKGDVDAAMVAAKKVTTFPMLFSKDEHMRCLAIENSNK